MKAVILCAGYGTRLGTITKDKPKPMIEIAGKPVIGHIVDNLRLTGIDQIIINLHYLPEIITNYIGSKALFYYEPVLLGHEKTISALSEWLRDDDFMVINGDTLNDVNYASMIANHKSGTITALMDEWRCTGTWIYSKEYFTNKNLPVMPYRPKINWFDIGTPERLKKAREYYEKDKSAYLR